MDNFIALRTLELGWSIYFKNVGAFRKDNILFNLYDLFYFQAEATDGSVLVNRTYLSTDPIQIYKLCNEPGYFYNSLVNFCEQCSSNCGECFQTSQSCLSCNSTEYLIMENRTCVACGAVMVHCLRCVWEEVLFLECLECEGGYGVYHSSCKACGELMIGCGKCQDEKLC